MASAVTITEYPERKTGLRKIKFAWTSHTDGVVTGVATTGYYTGKIEALVTDPGSTAPDDNYDIVIADDDTVDVLAGAGLNRDTTNTEVVVASSLSVVYRSKLTFSASGCGSSKIGVAYLYIR